MDKKQRAFDKALGEWKTKCNDLTSELQSAQSDARGYSAEVFKLKSQLENAQDAADALKRENKNLADEVQEIADQLNEGGRSSHELQKTRKRLEIEKEELQAALEEAESALEQEEAKSMRSQLEISSIRAEIDRRIQEKEEDFDNTR